MTKLIVRERLSPNQGARNEPPRIDMLVLHYTGMESAAAALDRLCDQQARVSAHYVVEEDGTVWRLVPDARRAFHAGLSSWEGEGDLNFVSIGIEIVNPGHDWGYRPFAECQMAAVEHLCRDILARHSIPAHRIIGHSDIAPERKIDPGELFDWRRLARAGIGIWPEPAPLIADREADRAQAVKDLAAIGYLITPENEGLVVAAFQRHFRQARVDGLIDRETASRLGEVRTAFSRSRSLEGKPV
jgi:N-acetylmuramoyl-L-alanine amidase